MRERGSLALLVVAGIVFVALCAALPSVWRGALVLPRFDLYPAAVTAAAVALILAGRDRLGSGVLGAAIAVKLYPAVLVPLAVAWAWRRKGRREALIASGVCLAVALAVF